MGGPAAALAGDWGLEMELELAGDASDFAFDAEDEALKGTGTGIEGEEMEAALGVAGETVEAIVDDVAFLVGEALGPEVVEVEIELDGAAGGVGGVAGEEECLFAEFAVPGFGHAMGAGVDVVPAGVAGGAGLAFGGAGAGRFLGVGTVGGELLVGHAGESHWVRGGWGPWCG